MIWTKSDEATASSASIVATAMIYINMGGKLTQLEQNIIL